MFKIGSENEDSEHIRGTDGWPYSIYIEANGAGGSDAVLCHGIQSISDARHLLALCNGDPLPALAPHQLFAWDGGSIPVLKIWE